MAEAPEQRNDPDEHLGEAQEPPKERELTDQEKREKEEKESYQRMVDDVRGVVVNQFAGLSDVELNAAATLLQGYVTGNIIGSGIQRGLGQVATQLNQIAKVLNAANAEQAARQQMRAQSGVYQP